MGNKSSSPSAPPPVPPPTAVEPPPPATPTAGAAKTKTKAVVEDCNEWQHKFKRCSALQYDRFLHPIRHKDENGRPIPPDYGACSDLFESWQECVMDQRKKGQAENKK
mmetsp:Transcript_23526/g.63307  ORF Transcript_23526/g.63307 Transcript_23526/m.63307 type:complete len:108 (+) Transcript_23526:159-482(+)